MSTIDWEREWKAVLSQALLSKCRVGDRGFKEYFDDIAEKYREEVRADEEFFRDIVRFLAAEDFLRDGDEVLDIACGPATYTLHLAERAKAVAALDPAPGMLAIVARESAARGLSNVRPIRSTWEDYETPDRYDLVFTALSPGIKGPAELMKMERYSRRSCCYIGFGEGGNNPLGDELWELVLGEKKNGGGFSIAYPFNLLHSQGRRPNVRFFRKESIVREPSDELIRSNLQWLGMFTPMGRDKEEKVREYIMARSTDGFFERKALQSLVALYWDVP